MDRDALLANLEWLLHKSPEPPQEVEPLGEALLRPAATMDLIASGKCVVISRRYLVAIIGHLRG